MVADDHKRVLQGLVSLLKEEEGIEVVGQAVNGREALEEIQRLRPDVALLDITMPEMSGLEVTRQVAGQFPDVKVLILTMHEEEAFFFEALRSGASVTTQSSGVTPVLKPRLECKYVRSRHKMADLERVGLISSHQD